MKKGRFFPEDHRTFCNGRLALNIDRFGGIESVHILNLQKFEDKIYPARRAWKLFSRDGRVQNRPYIDQKHENAVTPVIVAQFILSMNNDSTPKTMPAIAKAHQHPLPK